MKKRGLRKLRLHLETLRHLDGKALDGVLGQVAIEVQLALDTITAASNKRCTGCSPCITTG